MINFKLSPETKQALQSYKAPKLTKKQFDYYNSPEFYARRPDLAPRNVYLRMGRKLDMKTVRKTIDDFGKESFLEKCERWIKKFNDFIRCR